MDTWIHGRIKQIFMKAVDVVTMYLLQIERIMDRCIYYMNVDKRVDITWTGRSTNK